MSGKDTSLVRMVIHDIAEKYNIGYDEAIDRFYNSKLCAMISDEATGVFTYSPSEAVSLFDELDA